MSSSVFKRQFSVHVLEFLNNVLQVTEEKVSSLLLTEEVGEELQRQEVFQEVKSNMQKSQEKIRKRKQQRGKDDQFQVGDLVLHKKTEGGSRGKGANWRPTCWDRCR